MARKYNDEFKREAVRIALTSGLTRRQVASDLGVGFSTLAKWVQKLKQMRFAFIEEHQKQIPVDRLCYIMRHDGGAYAGD